MSLIDKLTSDPDEEEQKDFFEDDFRAPKPKEPKRPALRPDDPYYWEADESEWEHLKPSKKKLLWLWLVAAVVCAALILAVYLRFFSPYVEEAVEYGYIEHIEKRGNFFKTYEGVLIRYKELHDTTRLYKRDFIFTASDSEVATALKRMEYRHQPVRVSYKQYHATLPWRGASKIIVTAVDSVDPRSILPPEFDPMREMKPEN